MVAKTAGFMPGIVLPPGSIMMMLLLPVARMAL